MSIIKLRNEQRRVNSDEIIYDTAIQAEENSIEVEEKLSGETISSNMASCTL